MKQLGEITVADYMTRGVSATSEETRLTEAIRQMDSQRISVLPVIGSEGTVVGILSTTDLIEIIHEVQADLSALNCVTGRTRDFLIQLLVEQGDDTLVRDVMTSPVDLVHETENLVVSARRIVENGYRHLPVVDAEGVPIGMLSTSDFVRAFADHGKLLAG
jgi:CBS domain-containing membrane protein